jgi:hypothetical protein
MAILQVWKNISQIFCVYSNYLHFSFNCNEHYTYQYDFMAPFVQKLLDAHKRVLIYNGDLDTVCNAVGDQQFGAHDLVATKLVENQPWTIDVCETLIFIISMWYRMRCQELADL